MYMYYPVLLVVLSIKHRRMAIVYIYCPSIPCVRHLDIIGFSWQWKVLSHFVSLIKLWLIISWTVFKFLHFLTIYNYTSIRTDFFSRLVKVQFKKVMIWLLLYHYAFVFFLNRSLLSWRRESLSMKMMTRKKRKEGKKRKQTSGNTLH